MAQPEVAVIIPAWKATKSLRRAIESALAQTDIRVEVAVVDDCSPDETHALALEIAAGDPRVIVARQEQNAGPAAARNRAIAMTSAPWICPLDSDDFMEPGRLAALRDIAGSGDYDFVADDLLQVDEADITGPRRRLFSDEAIGLETVSFRDFVGGNLSAHHGGRREMGFLKPMMRRAFLDQHGLSYVEEMRLGEDFDLYARALLRGARFGLTDPCGYIAIVRENSLSGLHSTRDLRALVEADLRLLNDPQLTDADRPVVKAHYIETQKRWRWMRLIDAVKARDPVEALRCFVAPLPVIGTLIGNLLEQCWLRGGRLLARIFGRASGASDAK
ncbi:glycosyltransferase family 2 protein [Rhodobacteraceae bacterium NNCM2]|nr:glycosyltransferase family 2 protein [Coraliihabitans acroporae]